ncbi:amyloid-beta A4 precursor protein-binding family A member 2-like [Anopheles nili]|uniref:amyloid-beta A4 precursor protein-binding family A member 2-like n=1 Tax=Anopheles nili TaxID=185578 RepID=UPI00237C42B6|nr:amyloid-beta A4 precursor protein-binding family A member 2-like [Anopheles nili]
MYCSNDSKHTVPGSIGETKLPAMNQCHPHDLYGEKESELHFWEGRHGSHRNTTPVSTVLHSPEPTMAEHEPKIRFQQRHQIQVGRSPVGSGGHHESSDSTTASSPVLPHGRTCGEFQSCHHSTNATTNIAGLLPGTQLYSAQSLLADGEIVVFDDIEPNWPPAALNGPDMSVYMGGSTPGKDTSGDNCSHKIQTIIGGLTIAEYEGSPRRFGCIYSNSQYAVPEGAFSGKTGGNLPRPGFPKRVASVQLESESLDDSRPKLIELGKSTESTFYDRTSVDCNKADSYTLDTKYYNCQRDDEDDCAPASSGLKSHNFALSPDTDYRAGSEPGGRKVNPNVPADVCSKEILHETCVEYEDMCNSMPILEDGLSSGHASDSEGNTLANSGSLIDVRNANSSAGSQEPALQQHRHHHRADERDARNGPNGCGNDCLTRNIQDALDDIKSTLQNTKTLPVVERRKSGPEQPGQAFPVYGDASPVWVLRCLDEELTDLDGTVPTQPASRLSGAADLDEETDTDLETDRLLGHQQVRGELSYPEHVSSTDGTGKAKSPNTATMTKMKRYHTAIRADSATYVPSDITLENVPEIESKGRHKTREGLLDPAVLIEGVLFRARYLGSTQLVCEGQPTKSTRMMQAEEAVSRIKAPAGESQPSTEVDLFISTEKIMVLNTDLKEIMMDHALRTISYIADIGQLVVLMARRRFVATGASTDGQQSVEASTTAVADGSTAGANLDSSPKKRTGPATGNRTPKMICHVFESEEAQFIAQSIGQAFQVAYVEFLKANGIEDHSFMKELDYQEVLNSQEIFGDELEIFAKKELQKEVVVPKAKGEILGVVIVESGWGSMLPTVVIANLASAGAAARCGQLNIGDQIIAINGLSLVGLPLSTCQGYIKNTKNQTVVKFTVVPCAPVVEVKIKRPNTKYQLGFSVQNGVICSLLRGGIAERGGVRVGHRIIEINNQSVVAVPHEKIVNLLATSIGEILMKTMPTSMFRLLTGQENPIYI